MQFVHLHCHSNYSLLEGASSVEQLLDRAARYGMDAVALTDTNGMYAAVPFYCRARELGIKPILGVELRDENCRAVLLARSLRGYSRLCELVTVRNLSSTPNLNRNPGTAQTSAQSLKKTVTVPIFGRAGTSVGLPAADPHPEGEGTCRYPVPAPIPAQTRNEGIQNVQEIHVSGRQPDGHASPTTRKMTKMGTVPSRSGTCSLGTVPIFFADPQDDIFILSDDETLLRELASRGPRSDLIVELRHYGDLRSQRRIDRLAALAAALGLRTVATNGVMFASPQDYRLHRVLTAIREVSTIDALTETELAHKDAWFKPSHEMARLFAHRPDVLETARWIADQCNVELPMGTPQFPEFGLPAGETAFSHLWNLAFTGLRDRYHPLRPKLSLRLAHELDVIHRLGFASYFLVVWDIVQFARRRGIPIVGRGSAANSLVSYALGITDTDPFRYDLYFERFLNMSRSDCPDIDLDICWRRRDEVIGYVYTKYGADHVAMICTFRTFRGRSAVREIARAYGLTPHEIARVTSFLPHFRAADIRPLAEKMPECRGLPIDKEPWRSIVELAETVDGYPCHLSIHSGGVVISRGKLTDLVPLERSTKGIVITQYDMGPIERLGLVKMDLLGHRSLTVIADTVEHVRENRGIEIDVYHLPEPDRLTTELLRTGRTVGCFQLESPAMRSLLRSLDASTTMDLMKALSLIRPGPAGSGMKERYIARHLGEEPTTYLHPKLAEILGDTYGVMLYQEDILKVASAVAGMTLEEADALRRAMTKKRSKTEMARHSRRFVEKAVAAGVAEPVAVEIWRQIANFSEYSYCKAHAATYGELAYRCAYLKAHYPAEFLASVLTNRGGFYHPAEYVEEARRCGVRVAGPDVQHSRRGYTVEGQTIRVGLSAIRDLSNRTIESILRARGHGPFRGLGDFLRRTAAGRTETETLIRVGALDSFGRTRPELFWELRAREKLGTAPSERVSKRDGIVPIFADEESGPPPIPLPRIPQYSRTNRLRIERATLGFTLDDHPLEWYIPRFTRYPLVASTELQRYHGRRVNVMGWLIADRIVGLKGRGCMKFVTIEDAVGLTEVVLFPKIYQRYGHLLRSHGPFVMTGTVDAEHNNPSLIAESLTLIGDLHTTEHSLGVPPTETDISRIEGMYVRDSV